MPVDYSKWDALELSDDSDIEVHPNVDKRSFIRAKQNQIHAERQQRKHQIETLKYERIINDTLIRRISLLLASLKAHAADAQTRNPGEVAFQAVMESAVSLDPKDDQPPPRPQGVHDSEEPLPTYTKMMATLLDQVNKALDEKKVAQEDRYAGMVAEIEDHLAKVSDLQNELFKKLDELEKLEHSKITSESIHTGFDSSHVNKAKPGEEKVELLNPGFQASASSGSSTSTTPSKSDDAAATASNKHDVDLDDDDLEASPDARKFAAIAAESYRESAAFLASHPAILTERETDGLLVLAFDAALEGKEARARQCVHQALLLQYCRALGRDGVQLFFKRIMTPGHQARDVFYKDVQDTYGRIRTRAAEIRAQRAAAHDGGAEDGVEQIQLHAVEPGTVINIRIPAEGTQERKVYEGFKPEMRAALETGSLDEVNKVLGRMKVEEAEELVGRFDEAGILSLEEQLIDATTEEGKKRFQELQEEAKAGHPQEAAARYTGEGATGATAAATGTAEADFADDPE